MEIIRIMLHIFLAIAFFYILNWIGRHTVSLGYLQLSIFVKSDEAPAYNLILRILSPTIFIILVSTLLYLIKLDSLVRNIWQVVVFYFAFRTIYNLLLGRAKLINWNIQILQWIIAIPISYIVYIKIITKKTNLFPNLETIGNELWLIIIFFLYATLNNVRTSDEATRRRKKEYLVHVYNKYRKLYSKIISKNVLNQKSEILVYSIMIYEAFGRPKVVRIIENIAFPIKSKTLGLMQIKTDHRISDMESVIIGIEKINKDYTSSRKKVVNEIKKRARDKSHNSIFGKYHERMILINTLNLYNKDDDYISEVMLIYDQLEDLFYKNNRKKKGDQTQHKTS